MTNNYFNGIKSIEEAKKLYRRLAQELHPDHGGSEEDFKNLRSDFESFLKSFMASAFSSWEEENGKEASGNSYVFASILKDIMDMNIRIEVIGYWIYAFESYGFKDALKEKGFWFSKKHKAWVYSGSKKIRRASPYNLNQIKNKYGSHLIREHEENRRITAPV